MQAQDEGDDALDVVFEALSNPHRRRMVYLLGLQPWAISRLAEQQGLSLPAIHKHLKILEGAGLIHRRKQGRVTYVTLTPRPMQLLQSWVRQFHPYWGSAQASYENYSRHLGFEPTGEPEGHIPPTRPAH